MPAGAAQAFFQHRAGHARVAAGQQTGRMKLHHFHVAQRQAGAQRHGQAVHGFVAGWRVVTVHTWARAGRQQRRFGAHESKRAAAHVNQQRAAQRIAMRRRQQRQRAVFFQAFHRPGGCARHDLLEQAVHNFNAGQVAFMHGAVESLTGEWFLVNGTVGVAVEEATVFVFQLMHARDGELAQRPCDALVRQPLAALDGVHKMLLHRIAAAERGVVAALHHARAAAFAEQPFGRDGDF